MNPRTSTSLIIIHASYTTPNMDIGAETIRDWHVNDRGWSDIGYHYVIRRGGLVEKGRHENLQGAHAAGFNGNSIGICMVGGKGKEGAECNFTAAQWRSLETLVKRLLKDYPEASVIGHNDVSPKSCPTFDAKAWAHGLEV